MIVEEEVSVEDTETTAYEFDEAFQRKIAALVLRDSVFGTRTFGLIKADYFESESDSFIVQIVLDYFTTYKKVPDIGVLGTLIKSAFRKKKIRKDLISDIRTRLKVLFSTDISDRDYVAEQVADFAKNKAIEQAILASVPALERRDYQKIQELMNKAMVIGVTDDGGEYDYWNEIENRTVERIDLAAGVIKPRGITTGYEELDRCLLPHMGWGRKELSEIMGAAKAGKSMSLGDFGKNASLAGFHVFYASCEVSAKIIASRTDANVSETAMRALSDHPHKVKEMVKNASEKAGYFKIHEFASGSLKPSHLRRILERYRMRGIVFDLIVVDYADIMAPDRHSDSAIENLRTIYLDLRAIAFDYDAAVLTATQTNREGAKAAVAKMTDIAEDFNKVRTADVLISINSTEPERASGEARLYFAAMRNAEAGFTLRIKQDRASMRFITKIIGKE
jgi:replicative DNA helicase